MVLLEAELEGDHRHVPERVAQRLRFASLGVAEEVADDALVQSQDAREPREEVVEHRPDHDGKEDAEDAFFVERAQRLADGQQQQSGHHREQRHGGAEQRSVDGGPAGVLGMSRIVGEM